MSSEDENGETEDPKETRLPKNIILSEGNKYLRLLLFQKALSSFEKVLNHDPNDISSLLGRAKCYLRLAKYREAGNDLEKILKLKPKCTEAIYLKGVTEYLTGHFEKSFLTYWEGYRLRPPNCDRLRQGYQLCQKSIENSLDADTRMLLTEKDVRRMNQLLKNENLATGKSGFDSRVGCYDTGMFSSDLKFIKELLNDRTLTSVHSLCKDLSDYLKERQRFWKMQETFSKIDETSSMVFIKNDTCTLLKTNRLIRSFGLCKIALKERKTRVCIQKGTEVLTMLKRVPADFPVKHEMEAYVFHCLAIAHLIENRLPAALDYCDQQLSVVKCNNISEAQSRAHQDFGEAYRKATKYEEALQSFKESLQFVHHQFSEERALILYKISDCCMNLKNLQEAQNSAEECLASAVRSQDERFQFDVLLLLAEIALMCKNMKIAQQYYRTAFDIALRNSDPRQEDLEKLLDVFQEVMPKDSISNEILKIVEITDNIKNI